MAAHQSKSIGHHHSGAQTKISYAKYDQNFCLAEQLFSNHSCTFDLTIARKHMYRMLFFSFIFLLMNISCSSLKNKLPVYANQLLGTWVDKNRKSPIYETWEKSSNQLLLGKSYTIKSGDTTYLETISLNKDQNGRLLYIPVTAGQNDEKPVVFTSTHSSKDSMVFENKLHDFPQRITYAFVNKDSIYAEISGPIDGQLRKVGFAYARVVIPTN